MADQWSLWAQCERLLFQVGEQRRWIQDSPILPDVWKAFATHPLKPVDLLIAPHRECRPAQLAERIRRSINGDDAGADFLHERPEGDELDIAYNQSTVVARLYFNELIQHAMPMSRWFEQRIGKHLDEIREIADLKSKTGRSRLGGILRDLQQLDKRPDTLPPLVVWWLRLTGYFSLRLEAENNTEPQVEEVWDRALALLPPKAPANGREAKLFRIALNRKVIAASMDAVRVVKADAARRLFGIDSSRICWAILDSGIDVRHTAFHDESGKTRVKESYDFTRVRRLISLASAPGDDADTALQEEFHVDPGVVRRMRTALKNGGDVDWEALRPALQVDRSDEAYFNDLNPHGTHVAGILGGRPQAIEDGEDDFSGVCPDIRLIDLRILDKEGRSKDEDRHEEFDAIAALQFVGHLNSFGNELVIHGVNLSIQLQHDPTNFACGRTPVCEECNRLVANGVVVVAAAGNMGIGGDAAFATTSEGAFHDISIADPGNAESVITVGSTHRSKPHTYGVSFFSGRGPTGDGRGKPDLVAPGEKIVGPVGADGYEDMQGTSQAAPYVSGAAAMLLARHSELIGDPARVKAILCRTATDLGRLRDFQGAGLVDILRALQSV
jgi:serine protease AprX